MTECEKKELIKSIALGMPFEEISRVYEISVEEVNDFYKAHKAEIDEEIQFQKMKWGE